MSSHSRLQLPLQQPDPRCQSPRLLQPALEWTLKVQQVPVKPALSGELREQAGVVRRDRERARGVPARRACARGGECADEQAEGVGFAFAFEDPAHDPSRVEFFEQVGKVRTYSVPSMSTPCLCAALIHPGGGTVTLWWEKLHDLH